MLALCMFDVNFPALDYLIINTVAKISHTWKNFWLSNATELVLLDIFNSLTTLPIVATNSLREI